MTTLKEYKHKGYTVTIKGEFKNSYGRKYKGLWYNGGIEPTLIITDPLGVTVRHKNIYDLELFDSRLDYPHVAKYRVVEHFFFRKKDKLITIKEDLERLLKELTDLANKTIDNIIQKAKTKQYEKYITDGLPDSLDEISGVIR